MTEGRESAGSAHGTARTQASAAPDIPVPALNPSIESRLRLAGLDPAAVAAVVRGALAEDLAGGFDVTTAATVPEAERGRGDLVARTAGVAAGLPVAEASGRTLSAPPRSHNRNRSRYTYTTGVVKRVRSWLTKRPPTMLTPRG